MVGMHGREKLLTSWPSSEKRGRAWVPTVLFEGIFPMTWRPPTKPLLLKGLPPPNTGRLESNTWGLCGKIQVQTLIVIKKISILFSLVHPLIWA